MPNNPKTTDVPAPSNGCLLRLAALFMTLVCAALLVAVAFAFSPQDTSDLNQKKSTTSSSQRDITQVLKESSERSLAVTISQNEVNQWLKKQVVAKQKGLLASHSRISDIAFRFEENLAEIVTTREIFGKNFTFSTYFSIDPIETPDGTSMEIKLHGGQFHPSMNSPLLGGRFGKLKVPQGFTTLMLPEYRALCRAFEPELEYVTQKMVRIKIKKHAIELDPNVETDKPIQGGF